jgi:uncharacterized protein
MNPIRVALVTITAALSFVVCGMASVDAPGLLEGNWMGTLTIPSGELRVVFRILKNADGTYGGFTDSPDQYQFGIRLGSVTFQDGSVSIEVPGVGSYQGKMVASDTIEGGLYAGKLPLTLKRVEQTPEPPRRPQIPQKPYPYREEEVAYDNSAASVRIAGTLTIPAGNGPFPAVLLIAGSGAADRDETIFAHKPFLVLADHLTRKGIAVLRVDKRGVGQTTGTFRGSGIKDFASDALAGVQYLKTRPEVDGKKIGLVGHSEGGATASVVAAQTHDVAYIVLLGSMGMSGYDILVLQDGTEARAAGKSDEEIALIRGYSRRFYSIILEETERTAIEERARKLQDSLTEAEKKALGWPNLGGSLSLNWALNPAAREMLQFDICPILRKVSCPVLALNGSKDSQVPPKENLGGIARELKAGGNRNVTIREMPGMNHLFQTCETGATSEYVKIEETMAPAALEAISSWIAEQR